MLTDDQRFDTLAKMPNVRRHLMHEGVTFTNASVVTPLCCPSRASILTGRYAHNTGVWTNRPPMGGVRAFDASSTIATWLHEAGYRTMFAGKYINGYGTPGARGRPAGWDRFAPVVDRSGFGDYVGYVLEVDGERRRYGRQQRDHSTVAFPRLMRGFIREAIERHPADPFFAMLGMAAPHEPFIPLRRDAKSFSNLPPWRPPSFAELKGIDRDRLQQYRTLAGVDREVGRLVKWLDGIGELDRTMFIFTSDNGYLWGEHGLKGKSLPYEESIRVPMVIRFDPLTHGLARRDARPVLNIDLAPTMADVAGIEPSSPVDGASLLPILAGDHTGWRKNSLFEYADGVGRPDFCGLRGARWKLIVYDSGAKELFHLPSDRWEMDTRIGDQVAARVLERLLPRLRRLCRDHPTVSLAGR